jgi:hypothetical protein
VQALDSGSSSCSAGWEERRRRWVACDGVQVPPSGCHTRTPGRFVRLDVFFRMLTPFSTPSEGPCGYPGVMQWARSPTGASVQHLGVPLVLAGADALASEEVAGLLAPRAAQRLVPMHPHLGLFRADGCDLVEWCPSAAARRADAGVAGAHDEPLGRGGAQGRVASSGVVGLDLRPVELRHVRSPCILCSDAGTVAPA